MARSATITATTPTATPALAPVLSPGGAEGSALTGGVEVCALLDGTRNGQSLANNCASTSGGPSCGNLLVDDGRDVLDEVAVFDDAVGDGTLLVCSVACCACEDVLNVTSDGETGGGATCVELEDCAAALLDTDEGFDAAGLLVEGFVDGLLAPLPQFPNKELHPSPQYASVLPCRGVSKASYQPSYKLTQNPPEEQQFPHSLPTHVKLKPPEIPQFPLVLVDCSPSDTSQVPYFV